MENDGIRAEGAGLVETEFLAIADDTVAAFAVDGKVARGSIFGHREDAVEMRHFAGVSSFRVLGQIEVDRLLSFLHLAPSDLEGKRRGCHIQVHRGIFHSFTLPVSLFHLHHKKKRKKKKQTGDAEAKRGARGRGGRGS